MATFKIWSTDNAYKAVWYITKPQKTMDQNGRQNISALNMDFPAAQLHAGERDYRFPASEAAAQFQKTKERFHNTEGRQAYHAEQSFYPGEVTPERAHEIGVKFAKEAWPDFEVVVATHVDRKHIHNHFVLNSVSCMDGSKYRDDIKGEEYQRLRNINDRLCGQYGLSVIANPSKGRHKNYKTWQREQDGEEKTTVRAWIREDIDRLLPTVTSLSQLYDRLQDVGYQVDTSGKYVKVKPKGKDRFFRLHKLDRHGNYTEEKLYDRIQENLFTVSLPPKDPSGRQYILYRARISVYLTRRLQTARGHSLYGTYLAYRHLAKLHRAGKRWTSMPSMRLREAARDLERFSDKTVLLCTEHIHTLEDLSAHRAVLEEKRKTAAENRTDLRAMLRKVPDVDNAPAVRAEIENLSQEIKTISYQVRLCEEIAAEAQALEEETREVQRELAGEQEKSNEREERKE